MTKATQTPKIRALIESNRAEISRLINGADTVKRLNNVRWIRRELEDTEPRALFYIKGKDQPKFLDYSNMTNIGLAYDYIVEHLSNPIDATEICKLHSYLCNGTYISGGITRHTNKILEIIVNGQRYHAPDPSEIPFRLNEIVYNMNNTDKDTLTRAFEAHYELIMLQPFDDFNKRTSRLVMNWVLMQGGYRPIMFNKPSEAVKYREAITAMANGDRKSYTQYMQQSLLRSQKLLLDQLKKSRII